MADNVTLNSMTGGSVVGADDISSVYYQRIKLIFGADGVNSGDVSSSNGLPVTLLAGSASIGILGANSGVDIGDVTINNASGGSAVNIQDGGNSITIDGSLTTVTTVTTVSTVTTLTTITNVVHVDDNSGSLTVDNGGTFAVQDSQVVADNAGFTDGTTKLFMTGYIFDETAGTALTENDAAAARVDSKRAVVNVFEDSVVRGQRAKVDYQNRLAVAPANGEGVTISGNVLLETQRQPINTSVNGATLISGVANRKIRVLNGLVMAASATTIQFKSGNNSDCTGPLALGANGGYQIPQAEIGNFETKVGEALTIVLSAANQVGGWLSYVIV